VACPVESYEIENHENWHKWLYDGSVGKPQEKRRKFLHVIVVIDT
jgi:hypothetical protein